MYAESTAAVPRGRHGASLTLRVLLGAMSQIRCGRLRVTTADGHEHEFEGAESGPCAAIHLHDPAALRKVFTRSDLGFAEAYMEGAWDTPDLASLLELGAVNEDSLAAVLATHPLVQVLQFLRHRLRRNSRRGSRRNIEYHYDLGNDFYRLWLDPGMTYSSAIFEHPGQSLGQAQQNKYRRLIERLGIGAADHVLEIGCGWGGFAVQAARDTGCRVTGITLSREQLAYARERVQREGLADRVELRLQDYRDVGERFDHIASVEMFEAVGERYWPVFFRTVHDRLRPGGRAALQVITIDDAHFEGYRSRADFIQRYIFPGGMLPSPRLFAEHSRAAGLSVADAAFFADDYARTLACWDERVQAQSAGIARLGFDNRFLRMWRYYLAYCEAGFRTRRVDLMQVVLERRPA